jgi:LmbE family N-acetylglucosaminyl deacetylase
MAAAHPITVLHLAPHPDDEAIAAAATLLALREAGHVVVNAACSLGHAEDADRREAEVREACRRADFALELPPHPIGISAGDDMAAAEAELTAWTEDLIRRHEPRLVVSPSPHDGHHGHEVVGRAARNAVAADRDVPLWWWMWGLWADLPLPTLYCGFDDRRLGAVLRVLGAHAGELARNDYAALVRARAIANRVLGSERVFGFGAEMQPQPYAELLTEATVRDGAWLAGEPRALDPDAPLADAPGSVPLGWWLDQPSFTTALAACRPALAPGRTAPSDR